MRCWSKLAAGSVLWGALSSAHAVDIDPFGTRSLVSGTPAAILLGPDSEHGPCHAAPIPPQIDLAEALERALCTDPKTRQAWANAKLQAAQVGLAQSAYLPGVGGSATRSSGYYDSEVKDVPELDYQQHASSYDVALNLTWTLYDFGLRHAHLESARQLLAAAAANQDAALQATLADAAQAYYELQSAQGALAASRDTEQAAKESFDAANAKHNAGIGALADKLQAQTNYAQARLNSRKAEGDAAAAHGALALVMGLPAGTAFELAPLGATLPDTSFVESVDKLMDIAKQRHPTLLAAQAQWQAAQSDIAATRAEGMPSLSLVGSLDRNEQPGQYSLDTTTRTNSIGVQLKIPLFEGFGRSYRVQAAKAQAEAKAAALDDAERQVALNVWKSFQTFTTETGNLKTTEELLQSALDSFDVAQGRYKSGVGTIIELLNAQTALADARRQKVQALADWRTARIRLAAGLGTLGMWAAQK